MKTNHTKHLDNILNGYLAVFNLKRRVKLTPEQVKAIQANFPAMRENFIPVTEYVYKGMPDKEFTKILKGLK